MRKLLLSNSTAVIIALMAGSCLSAAVDFTPITKTREFDGVHQTYIAFRDGGTEITFDAPADWRINGSGSKLTLAPNAIRNVDAQVEVKPAPVVVPIDATNLKKYIEVAQKTMPPHAQNVQVLGTTINPLKICGHDTLAINLQYEAFGATYRCHLLYLNRDREQWVFQLSAPDAVFERAFEPFRRSMYSLQGL